MRRLRGTRDIWVGHRRNPGQLIDVWDRKPMFNGTRDDEIPVPIERHTGRVDMPVTGDVGRGAGSAFVKQAELNGTPSVASCVHALYPVEPSTVGVGQLVQDTIRYGCFFPCRNERAFARAIPSDLVEPNGVPGKSCDAAWNGRRCTRVKRRVSMFEPYAKYFMRPFAR